jgi:hypothetical protein
MIEIGAIAQIELIYEIESINRVTSSKFPAIVSYPHAGRIVLTELLPRLESSRVSYLQSSSGTKRSQTPS